ncbi:hypothetical protein [Stomatohabitans albus]|uniref:hypothetical protein n=1 Tax=Stomatohabitans albus TaxID=3110766 RepID=UPI00300CF3E1
MNDAQYLTQVTPEAPVARRDLVTRWVDGFAVANVIIQFLVVVAHAIVRVAKAGLIEQGVNCYAWPDCEPNAHDLPFAGYYTTIDTAQWVLLLLAIVSAVGLIALTLRTLPTKRRPHRIHTFAALPLAGVIVQAILGLCAAIFPAIQWLNVAHTAWSFVLIALTTWLVIRLGRPDVPLRPATGWSSRLIVWGVAILAIVAIGSGVLLIDANDAHIQALPFADSINVATLTHAYVGDLVILTAAVVGSTVWIYRSPKRILQPGRRVWAVLVGLLGVDLLIILVQVFIALSPIVHVLHVILGALSVVTLMTAVSYLYPRIPVLSLMTRAMAAKQQADAS